MDKKMEVPWEKVRWRMDVPWGNLSLREELISALGKIQDHRALGALLNALKDDQHHIRYAAASALRERNDPNAVLPLIETLKDEYWKTRFETAWALGLAKDSQATEPLIHSLNDKSPYVQKAAIWALGEIQDPLSIEPLINALNDERFVQRGAMDTLKIKDEIKLALVKIIGEDFIKDNLSFSISGKQYRLSQKDIPLRRPKSDPGIYLKEAMEFFSQFNSSRFQQNTPSLDYYKFWKSWWEENKENGAL